MSQPNTISGLLSSLCLMHNEDKRPLIVFGCDMVKQTAGSYYCQKHFQVPSGTSKNYAKTILKICLQNKIKIIMPLSEGETVSLAKEIEMFKSHGINMPVSDYASLSIATDKVKLFNV